MATGRLRISTAPPTSTSRPRPKGRDPATGDPPSDDSGTAIAEPNPTEDAGDGEDSGDHRMPVRPRPTSSDPDPNISYGAGGGMRTTAGSGVVDPDATEQAGGGPGVLDRERMGNGPEAARG